MCSLVSTHTFFILHMCFGKVDMCELMWFKSCLFLCVKLDVFYSYPVIVVSTFVVTVLSGAAKS